MQRIIKRTREIHFQSTLGLGFVLLFVLFVFLSSHAHALDLNAATEADLDSLNGIGPATTARILQARAQAPFGDWADFRHRVKGFGPHATQRLSAQGVTINGQRWGTPPPQTSKSP
jgi:competence protein ComEA